MVQEAVTISFGLGTFDLKGLLDPVEYIEDLTKDTETPIVWEHNFLVDPNPPEDITVGDGEESKGGLISGGLQSIKDSLGIGDIKVGGGGPMIPAILEPPSDIDVLGQDGPITFPDISLPDSDSLGLPNPKKAVSSVFGGLVTGGLLSVVTVAVLGYALLKSGALKKRR